MSELLGKVQYFYFERENPFYITTTINPFTLREAKTLWSLYELGKNPTIWLQAQPYLWLSFVMSNCEVVTFPLRYLGSGA